MIRSRRPVQSRNLICALFSVGLVGLIYLAFRFCRSADATPWPLVSSAGRGGGGSGGRKFATDESSRTRPHIVLILADDYGFNDIGYRNPVIKTPHLDALAEAGVKLDNYYVQPLCSPSRAQLMAGRHPIHMGLQHSLIWAAQPNCLPVELPTLADKLREAGYATHMTGKWHLGYYKRECLPTRRGFQSFLGLTLGRGDHYNHTSSWYLELFNGTGLDFREGEKLAWNYTGHYSTHVFAERAEHIINEHNLDQPLFLYVPFQAVHEPLQVPKQYLEPFAGVKNDTRQAYMGMTYAMDEAVGNITAALRRRGMWENTVLVFSSDNGGNVHQGASNWPLRGSKGTLWEGGIRALGFVTSPLLPETVRGTVNKGLFDISDWFPTLIEGIAEWSVGDTPVDGYNIWDAIREGSASPRLELLHNIDPDPIPLSLWDNASHATGSPSFNTYMVSALRLGDWKLITGYQSDYNHAWYAPPESSLRSLDPTDVSMEKTVFLFNVKEDPSEYYDLADQEPDIVQALMDRLRHYQGGAVPVRFPPMNPLSNPELYGGAWVSWGSLPNAP